jgi:hypothetical protein
MKVNKRDQKMFISCILVRIIYMVTIAEGSRRANVLDVYGTYANFARCDATRDVTL